MVKTLTYLIYSNQKTSPSTLPKSNVGLKVKIKRERHALKTADVIEANLLGNVIVGHYRYIVIKTKASVQLASTNNWLGEKS